MSVIGLPFRFGMETGPKKVGGIMLEVACLVFCLE